MSAFLGPIHYWLYQKIGNQERLTAALATESKKLGWIEDASIYCIELPALETVIDEGNIHGWLQNRIADAEERFAEFIGEVLEADELRLEKLREIAAEFGRQNAPEAGLSLEEIYKYFEDFFVNGMPCERINQVREQDKERVSWEMAQDIHGKYWPHGDATVYYILRKAVMDGMLEGHDVQVIMEDPFHYVLEIK